jgi:hypothetical protein
MINLNQKHSSWNNQTNDLQLKNVISWACECELEKIFHVYFVHVKTILYDKFFQHGLNMFWHICIFCHIIILSMW